jgi:hypothetical protein
MYMYTCSISFLDSTLLCNGCNALKPECKQIDPRTTTICKIFALTGVLVIGLMRRGRVRADNVYRACANIVYKTHRTLYNLYIYYLVYCFRWNTAGLNRYTRNAASRLAVTARADAEVGLTMPLLSSCWLCDIQVESAAPIPLLLPLPFPFPFPPLRLLLPVPLPFPFPVRWMKLSPVIPLPLPLPFP